MRLLKSILFLGIALFSLALYSASLNLTWVDRSSNEDGFLIERSIDGTNFVTIWETPPDVEQFTDDSLLPATEYFYRLRAFNEFGNSGYSNVASGTTPAEGFPPTPPGSINLEFPGRLTNISSRGPVAVGAEIVIGGFTIEGGPAKVLVRAIGPSLAAYGIQDPLADPTLTILLAGTQVAENDNWIGQEIADAASQVGAFALPVGSKDSAWIGVLPAGQYTTQLRGVAGATGVALIEVYQVPQ